MQELQARVKSLQRENDQLQAQVEKNCELGKDVRDGDHAEHPIACNKEKEPITSGDSDALIDDELSFGRSPSTSPPLGRNARGSTRAKSRRKHSHCPVLPAGLRSRLTGGRTNLLKPHEMRQCYLTAR